MTKRPCCPSPASSSAAICAVWIALAGATAAQAQDKEPSGLQAALIIEQALIETIAKAEKSIVAIAQSRAYDRDKAPTRLRTDPFAPGLQRDPARQLQPQDADFVPTEYATGVVIDRRGLILTNFHVLGHKTADYDVKHWITTADRKTREATIKAADPRSDLAVLEIDATDLQPIALGDGGNVKKGQLVVALGNPYAIARDGQASASHGIIANISRKAGAAPVKDEARPETKPTIHHYGTLIQTDAKLNLGTSGGALINLRGELIGLTTAAAAAAGYEQSAGYAIPVDETFRRILSALKDGRDVDYGFLGVSPPRTGESIPPPSSGMRVGNVVQGTAAARSGLRMDDVITHVNGEAVHDADQLFLLVGRLPSEAQVQLSILRDERAQKIPVTLTKYPVSEQRVVTAAPPAAWRGIRVDYVTAQPNFKDLVMANRIPNDPCVQVVNVEKDSPASAAGIEIGMCITHVGDTRVDTPRAFYAEANRANDAALLRLLVEEKINEGPIVRYEFKPQTKTVRAK